MMHHYEYTDGRNGYVWDDNHYPKEVNAEKRAHKNYFPIFYLVIEVKKVYP